MDTRNIAMYPSVDLIKSKLTGKTSTGIKQTNPKRQKNK